MSDTIESCLLRKFAGLLAFVVVAAQAGAQSTDDTSLESLISGRPMFSGAALISNYPGTRSESGSAGLRDRDSNQPFQTVTRYNTGSFGKFMTMIAIMQLHDDGRINLDTPVIEYLPEFEGLIAETVLVEHLLAHRSGLPEILELGERLLLAETNHDYVRAAFDAGFSSAGPVDHVYVNTNFMMLGEIVERVSDRPYEDYVRTEILQAAGVSTDPFIRAEDMSIPGVAAGYLPLSWDDYWAADSDYEPTGFDDFRFPARPVRPHRMANAAGGHYYSVEDLDRFARALMDGRLLSPDSLDTACSVRAPYRESNPDTGYGWGCEIYTLENGYRLFGHTGGAPGVDSYIFFYPEMAQYAVVISNFDGQGGPLWRDINRMLVARSTLARD